jgi:signal transduction histidine kinase
MTGLPADAITERATVVIHPESDPGRLPMPGEGEDDGWINRWMQPTGRQSVILSLLVGALVALVTLLVYETGGTTFVWAHLMYLPIILAATTLGIYGGVAAALVAAFAVGPYMPMDVRGGLPQPAFNWISRTVLFLVVGAFNGSVSSLLHSRIVQLKKAHRRLFQAHQELKNAQMRLIQTAKLESIGRLTASVAHEVKNPLAVIQLGLDYLTRTGGTTASRDSAETLQEMADAVQRADTIIKGLLSFSRTAPLTVVLGDLNSLLEESLLLVKHELVRHHVSLEKRLAASLPEIELDRNKVKQVFINLFMNAAEAMGDAGTLSVETSMAMAGQGVRVEIEDTGTGIPQDNLEKLFEPFFSTKPIGSGTGLGLSLSRNIIDMHQGTITIGNRKDSHGAIVAITFPVPSRG